MSGPACILPGPVISPDFAVADFAIISSPLTLSQSSAHNLKCDGNGGAVIINLNTSPSFGEKYTISHVGGAGSVLNVNGKAGGLIVSVATMTATTLFYDFVSGDYVVWGTVTIL
jgi:hypothetical protein